jgi:hypothetical protein
MKRLLDLWSALADELASICHTSATRDYETVTRRVEHEGSSFLTITLPGFGKDFERSLSQGTISDDLFRSFRSGEGGLPHFLGGFLRNVFDEHGALRNCQTDLLIDSIFAVRQLCGLYSKIELECTAARKAQAVRDYVDADQEARDWDETHMGSPLMEDFVRIAHLLYRDCLSWLDKAICEGRITPQHGPGAVADRLLGNQKFDLKYWPARLESTFPYGEWALPGFGVKAYCDDAVASVVSPMEDEELPSRMVLVPKTMKGPRVIAAEPSSLQYMQQGISRTLVTLLETDLVVGPMIGFSDQGPNRDLAQEGSSTGRLATLDMKEASDRVSLSQALALAGYFPWFREALQSTRSQLVALPTGEVVTLGKFASMGSALCFPIEAMVFLTGIFIGIERKLIAEGSRRRLTRSDIMSLHGSVRVYGDDIVVPVDCVDSVLDVFQQLGWKVNVNKSFWTGMFRESCGGDFYAGQDVTPVKVRREFPNTRKDVEAVVSLVSLRNQFYWLGMWRTAAHLDKSIMRVLPIFPIVDPTSPILGRESVSFSYEVKRLHEHYQTPITRGWVVSARIPRRESSDVGKLLKCLLASYEEREHLLRSGRPLAVDLKLRWSPPY